MTSEEETMVSSFSVEDATRKGPPQCRPICVPFFLVTVLYVQLLHGLATLLLLLGIQVPPDKTGVHLLGLVGTSFATTSRSHPVMDDTSAPVMFLSNHRSWGDFVVDCTLLGSPSFISRTLVALGIPFTAAYGFLRGWIWFFQRGKKRAGGTVEWTARFWAESHDMYSGKGVVMYPEGTRSLSPEGLPLKPGGLVSVHRLGWPVQIVITTNKEFVMAEKVCVVGCGTKCVSSVSAPVYPSQQENPDEFIQRVQEVWNATWKDAYSSAGVERPSPQLPGVQDQQITFSFAGPLKLQIARVLAVLLVVCLAIF